MPPHSNKRTIIVTFCEPWLLGWCRWEITTDLVYNQGSTIRSTLASGKWKWRGRNAKFSEATVDAEVYWSGPPITVTDVLVV